MHFPLEATPRSSPPGVSAAGARHGRNKSHANEAGEGGPGCPRGAGLPAPFLRGGAAAPPLPAARPAARAPGAARRAASRSLPSRGGAERGRPEPSAAPWPPAAGSPCARRVRARPAAGCGALGAAPSRRAKCASPVKQPESAVSRQQVELIRIARCPSFPGWVFPCLLAWL